MFDLTNEQKDIRQAAREFAEKEFRDVARELDENEKFDDTIWKKAAENGFIGAFIPEQYGGAGLGSFEQCLIFEEIARVDGGIAQTLNACHFGTQMINLYGTEEQKNKYLPPVCAGVWRAGMASTEPDAGSDVAAMTTSAVSDGDEYVHFGHQDLHNERKLRELHSRPLRYGPDEPQAARKVFDDRRRDGPAGLRGEQAPRQAFHQVLRHGGDRVQRGPGAEEQPCRQGGQGLLPGRMEFFNRARLEGGCSLAIGTAQGALDKAISHVKKRKAFGDDPVRPSDRPGQDRGNGYYGGSGEKHLLQSRLGGRQGRC